ncbi:MAG: hypothetical protein Q6370_009825 [Candidatus Sigynarchaeota archaeon]
MVLNWTVEVILGLVSLVPYLMGCAIAAKNFKRHREAYALLLMLGWIITTLYVFVGVLAVLLMVLELYVVTTWIFIIFGFFIILLVDAISRESIDPVKIGLWCVVAGMCIVFSTYPGMAQRVTLPSGELSINYAESVQGVSGVAQLGIFFLWLYYTARINKHAPRRMKPASRMLVSGAALVAIGIPAIIFLAIDVIPGGSFLPGGVGTLLAAMAFAKDPNLAYVLPARVLRLTVIDANNGIRLFSHTWRAGSEMADDDLFSGALQGISLIVNETMGRGYVREIRMDEGIMILQMIEGPSVACVLVATNSSRTLRISLARFGEQFGREYKQFFKKGTGTVNVAPFKTASSLIPLYFPFAE